MHYVLIATHTADVCPNSNAKTQKLLLETAPKIPKIAEGAGVKIVAGPFVNLEHHVVSVVEADKPDNVWRFLTESRLGHWNSVRVLPSLPMDEGLKEVQGQTPIF